MKHDLVELGKSFFYLQPLMDEVLEVRYTDLARQETACRELLRIAQAEDYNYGCAFAFTYLGDYYLARNNGRMAGELLQQASMLCNPSKFPELCMNLNIFLGIYYDMMMDQFMSLTYTLEALDLATQLGDTVRKSVILNNIANMLEVFGDMEAAKRYYYEGYRCINDSALAIKDSSHYALLMTNLVHLSCVTGEVTEAEMFLKEFEHITLSNSDNMGQYLVCCCHLAAVRGDFATIRSCTDQMIELLQDRSLWGYQFFEILMHIAQFALDFSDKDYAYKILTSMNELTAEGETGNLLRAQKYWVRYQELFGSEHEQSAAYKRYYQLKEIIDINNNKTMAEGLHAKISLRQAAKQQEVMQKITERLENEAQCDELTQLYNRRSFTSISEQESNNATVHSLGLVMIDVDYFKQYNDTYGHAEGDKVLRAVAEDMTKAAAGNQQVYNFRYGGDEFVCLYANCTHADLEGYLQALAELINNRQIPHQQSVCSNVVTLSVGYHIAQRAGDAPLDVITLLAQADKALYWTKGRGRNGCSRFTTDMEHILSQ